jgi:hypothetical protein
MHQQFAEVVLVQPVKLDGAYRATVLDERLGGGAALRRHQVADGITVSDEQTIRINITRVNQKAAVMVDGQPVYELTHADELIIKKSNKVHFMLSSPTYDYFERLNTKLQFGER